MGVPTGIELNEKTGQTSTPEVKSKVRGEQWFPGDLLQTSIGQMLHKYTPVQYAAYTATLANDGTRMKTSIVKEVRDYSKKEIIEQTQPVVLEQSEVEKEHFETIKEGMVAASRVGTAVRYFGDYPLDVASKTGTPQTADFPNSTFISYAPAEDPEIAIAVVIEKGWHGYTGAPVAKKIFDDYFGYSVKTAKFASEPEDFASSDSQENEGLSEEFDMPEESADVAEMLN